MKSKIIAPSDRNVIWLDEFPISWKFLPIKYLCLINKKVLPENTDPNFEFDYIDISSVNSDGEIIQTQYLKFIDAPSRARRIVVNNDVIISTVRTYLKAIAYLKDLDNHTICSTGFAVLTAGESVLPDFLSFWVRAKFFIEEIVSRSTGVSYPAISSSEIGSLPFPLIDRESQEKIAHFLKKRIDDINNLIQKKQKQIELLQEKRSALISHVVTKGLNPNVPMKDSGIEWIGKIPNHWDVKRVKTLGSFSKGRGINKDEIKTSGIPCIRYGEIYTDYNRIVYRTKSFIDEESSKKSEIAKKGDVLFTASGESVAEIGKTILYYGDEDIFVGGDIIILKLKDTLNPKFISYVMNSNYINHQKSSMSKGEIVVHIYSQQLKEIKTALPPLEEQIKISDYLDVQTTKIDVLLLKVKDSIAKLEEYRAALISATVTGRIDVRESKKV